MGGRRKREERRWVEGSGGERRGGERVHDRKGEGKTRSGKGAEIAGKTGKEGGTWRPKRRSMLTLLVQAFWMTGED